jgi:glycosyltransferase involved in cell wall biosynthesis
LVVIHVPIYLHDNEYLIATDWKRSLCLLRDSFNGRFGRIQVLAPSLDARVTPADQPLEPVAKSDDIDLFASFRYDTRARDFWRRHVHTWTQHVHTFVPQASVVHAGFCDVYRPLTFIGFMAGMRAGKTTVFVQDTDHVLQQRELNAHAPWRQRAQSRAYSEVFERSVRFGVGHASLSLLKGRALHARYGRYAKNAKNFHDTSYLSSEIVPLTRVERRCAELLSRQRPVRLVYCGRLTARKGLDESIDALMRARAQGAAVTLDIIGDGAERAALERQAQHLGAGSALTFHGMRRYGADLIADLAGYDALFFTPTAEDTPRMIFDGYAAGLPLIGYGIDYVRERAQEDGAARAVPAGDAAAAAALLCQLDRDRESLAALALRAHEAARYHAADAWYRRRAEWTYEAAAQTP